MLNQLFIWTIFIAILVLIIFIIKVISNSNAIVHEAEKNRIALELILESQNKRLAENNDKLKLIEDLQASLFPRYFTITRDIIFVQKHIFELYVK